MGKYPRTKGHKKALLKAENLICGICKHPITNPETATIDHIIPRSMGGSNRRDNVQLAHPKCNRHKGNLGYEPATPTMRKQFLNQLEG